MNDRTKSRRPLPLVPVAAGHLLGRLLAKVLCATRRLRKQPAPVKAFVPHGAITGCVLALIMVTGNANAQEARSVGDPSKTIYGERSPRAPRELDIFAFLIGKWEGRGKTRLPDGTVAEYPVSWVGRYILDGMAIADEAHGPYPDGTPSLGISFRQYDRSRGTWVVEFMNVSESFLRRQVHHGTGSVAASGRNVTVTSESPGIVVRERYLVPDDDNWVYRLDTSNDGGRSWNEGSIEFTFRRSK